MIKLSQIKKLEGKFVQDKDEYLERGLCTKIYYDKSEKTYVVEILRLINSADLLSAGQIEEWYWYIDDDNWDWKTVKIIK